MRVFDKILERMEAATCFQRVHLYSDRLINPKSVGCHRCFCATAAPQE